MTSLFRLGILSILASLPKCADLQAQTPSPEVQVEAHLQPVTPSDHHRQSKVYPSAVLWLKPLSGEVISPGPKRSYTLIQKNRMFAPHLLVVPVGSVVSFPNKDPFFHNVFSLFDGKRFDLGLYEAGTTRDVNFSREGVSYIFCNIHSEMSAVVLSLATPLYSIADAKGVFHLDGVPSGAYSLHVWVEGQSQQELDRLTRQVQLPFNTNLGAITYAPTNQIIQHTNKFNEPYDQLKQPPLLSNPYVPKYWLARAIRGIVRTHCSESSLASSSDKPLAQSARHRFR